MKNNTAVVVGAGLAGCEAAWALANRGVRVRLIEMKPKKRTPAHSSDGFAELVCSNSLKAARLSSAPGMLKEEMRRLGSIMIEAADRTSVPAGGALAVNRELFSDYITEKIRSHPNIEVVEEELTFFPENNTVIASGPLTSDALAKAIKQRCGEGLSFYDAAAPIVSAESINMEKAFFATRYDKGDPDYINCPMTRDEYEGFYQALVGAETAPLKDFDKLTVYEGCMPVEVLAKRGIESVRYGCMKPVGLIDPHTGRRPYAVVQLRKENNDGTLYNIVGFQTNLKFGEQKRVFSMIPGLENAEFMRFGVMHRNTFLDSPRLLDNTLMLKNSENIFFAGQITGTEGYCESGAGGIIAGINLTRRLTGNKCFVLPNTTMIGALLAYVSDENITNFQPMGANMGILPPLETQIRGKDERYKRLAERGLADLDGLLKGASYENCN